MYKRVLVIAAVGVALGAAWMQAKQADAAAAARLNATIVSSTVPSASPGACATTVGSFAAICPAVAGPSACQCVKITGATLTGNFGKGTADLLITEDPTNPTSTGDSNCVPFFGTATLNGTKGAGAKAKTQTGSVNIVGADCDAFTTSLPETISGGFGIAVPSPSPAVTGWGNLKGTVNKKGVMKLNLTGPLS